MNTFAIIETQRKYIPYIVLQYPFGKSNNYADILYSAMLTKIYRFLLNSKHRIYFGNKCMQQKELIGKLRLPAKYWKMSNKIIKDRAQI